MTTSYPFVNIYIILALFFATPTQWTHYYCHVSFKSNTYQSAGMQNSSGSNYIPSCTETHQPHHGNQPKQQMNHHQCTPGVHPYASQRASDSTSVEMTARQHIPQQSITAYPHRVTLTDGHINSDRHTLQQAVPLTPQRSSSLQSLHDQPYLLQHSAPNKQQLTQHERRSIDHLHVARTTGSPTRSESSAVQKNSHRRSSLIFYNSRRASCGAAPSTLKA